MTSSNSTYPLVDELLAITRVKATAWCEIVQRMGGKDGDRMNSWNTIYKQQAINLFDEMLEEVQTKEKELLNTIEHLLEKSESLCKDLHKKMPDYGSEGLSLYAEQEFLQQRIEEYEQLLEGKRKQIRALNSEQTQLSQALGRLSKVLPLSPLPTEDDVFDYKRYIESLESEKFEREEKFLQLKGHLTELANELKYKPSLDFERTVLSHDDSLFLVTDANMRKLEDFHDSLKRFHDETNEEIMSLREKIRYLWGILAEDLVRCDAFLQQHTGASLDTLEALRQEVKRCEAVKKANIEKFVGRLRIQLINMWDKCHFTEAQRDDFEYFHTSLYTEDLLSLHDIEIEKLTKYYNTNSNLYNLLEKRNELWTKREELEERATAPDRYKNRGGQLLKEEKERNALTKRLPMIEEQLKELAREHEQKFNRPFLSWGKTIDAIIAADYCEYDEKKKLKLSVRKQQRDKTITPGRSVACLTTCASTQNLAHLTPSVLSVKRKINTPLFPAKRTRVLGELHENVPRTAPPKLKVNGHTVGPSRYSTERRKRIEKCRRISQRMEQKRLQKENTLTSSEDYDEFKDVLGSKQGCRSTLFRDHEQLAVPLPSTPLRPMATTTNPQRRTPGANTNTARSPLTASKLSTAPSLRLEF